jgi:hypothetical protein
MGWIQDPEKNLPDPGVKKHRIQDRNNGICFSFFLYFYFVKLSKLNKMIVLFRKLPGNRAHGS